MQEKIKAAFSSIHADPSLRFKTERAIEEKLCRLKKKTHRARRLAPVLACLVLCVLGIAGYISYSTPVAAISLDINPSIELEINRYDRVIAINGYNSDGASLAKEVPEIKNMKYTDAVQTILENERIVSCLNAGDILEITVSGSSEQSAKTMQECISAETTADPNYIYCSAGQKEIAAAHALGVSFGKYRLLLQLLETDPGLTMEDVQGLSMRELRKQLESSLSGEEASESNGENGGNGNGGQYGNGNGNYGNCSGSGAGTGSGGGNPYGNHAGKGNGYGNKS